MEALLQSLATKYGMEKAIQLLGLDQQTQNPKYAISMGGTTLDVGNMAKRGLLNRGINAITSGGMLGPGLLLGGALGLGYLTNPLREGSFNYNPNLQGQIDYASGKGYIGKNSNTGLMQYGPESVLSGQNVISGFGTNDYRGQLQNYIDKMESIKEKGYNTIFGKKTTGFTDFQQSQLDKAKEEQDNFDWDQLDKDMELDASIKAGVQSANDDTPSSQGGGGSNNYGSFGEVDTGSFEQDGTGRQGYGSGGIASLWQR